MTIREALFLVVGIAAGTVVAWLIQSRQVRKAKSLAERRKDAVIKLGHDIRGAVTPALLMTERLEINKDESVRQAAAVIASAMERTAELAKAASAEARGIARGEPRDT